MQTDQNKLSDDEDDDQFDFEYETDLNKIKAMSNDQHNQKMGAENKQEQEMSLTLIKKNCVSQLYPDFESLTQSFSLNLSFLKVRNIDNLELFEDLQHLYLQNNRIRKIENLECLQKLEYLGMNGNLVEVVEGLEMNRQLRWLEIKDNCINEVRMDGLPDSLTNVDMTGNHSIDHDKQYEIQLLTQMVRRMKQLDQWNGQQISIFDKMKLLGYHDQIDDDYYNQQDQDEDQYEDEYEYVDDDDDDDDDDEQRFKKEWEQKYKRNEQKMAEDGIEQINSKTQNIMESIKNEGKRMKQRFKNKIEEYEQIHRTKIEAIRKTNKKQ